MNADQFFILLNETNDSYLKAAHQSMTEKPARAWFRPALIAACLTLVLIAIPMGIMIGNHTITPTVPIITPSTTDNTVTTTQAPETTEKPKASILDIPSATLFENDGSFLTTEGRGSSGGLSYDLSGEQTVAWAKRVQKENSAVLGIIKSYTSVIVPDGKAYYRITTMEITVLEDYTGIGSETVTAVYANRYEWDLHHYIPATQYILGEATYRPTNTIVENFGVRIDMFEAALECTKRHSEAYPYAALLLLKDIKDNALTVGENTYPLSDYADYILDACLDYAPNFDFFSLFSLQIPFIFRTGLIREVFMKQLSVYDGMGYTFNFKNSYTEFDNHTAFSFGITKFQNFRSYETDSIFSEKLFTESENTATLNVNPDYKWVLTIDEVTYEITRFDVKNPSHMIEVYLDLGSDFTEGDFENVRLDIYDSKNNLLCYADFS